MFLYALEVSVEIAQRRDEKAPRGFFNFRVQEEDELTSSAYPCLLGRRGQRLAVPPPVEMVADLLGEVLETLRQG